MVPQPEKIGVTSILSSLLGDPEVSHHTEDGVYIKQIIFTEKGMTMGQHSHKYNHAHMVASGSIRVWVDGKIFGDFNEGDCIKIQSGKKHIMQSLTEKAIGYCIHNLHGYKEISIEERNVLE